VAKKRFFKFLKSVFQYSISIKNSITNTTKIRALFLSALFLVLRCGEKKNEIARPIALKVSGAIGNKKSLDIRAIGKFNCKIVRM
jgi:hypothetical protein